jgi:indole-3-glycerol phosphate synthase
LRARAADGFALIAEIKKASPSKGLIRPDFQPADHARAYEAAAACLSVLTDAPYFQGHETSSSPPARPAPCPSCARTSWSIPGSRRGPRDGADAILIIVAALEDAQMAEIEAAAREAAWMSSSRFTTRPKWNAPRAALAPDRRQQPRSQALRDRHRHDRAPRPLAPEGTLLVAESGINTHADLVRLRPAARTFLVGESLMRQADVAAATRRLLEG